MEPLIRQMTRPDVPRVYEIECACFRSPWSRDALLGELKNDAAHYRVLDVGGEIIGYAGMWIVFDEAHIMNVAVLAEHRKNGYGELLMRTMMRDACSLGAACMTLEVRETNFAAQRLYERLGFEKAGFRARYYTDTGEGALLLWNRDIQKTISAKPLQ